MTIGCRRKTSIRPGKKRGYYISKRGERGGKGPNKSRFDKFAINPHVEFQAVGLSTEERKKKRRTWQREPVNKISDVGRKFSFLHRSRDALIDSHQKVLWGKGRGKGEVGGNRNERDIIFPKFRGRSYTEIKKQRKLKVKK